jgi:hypothetical protein
MTLSTLLANLYARLNYPSTPQADVTSRLTLFLNQRYRRLLSQPALRQLREGVGTFASVASQPEYGLQGAVARITAIRDTTNRRMLAPIAWEVYRQAQPDPSTETGTPDAWAPLGMRALFRKTGGTVVYAASSSAADTTQVVHSSVSRSDSTPTGLPQSFTTNLNGTTRVQIGNGTYEDVFSLSLSAVAAGAVTFYDAAVAGNALGVIAAGRRTARVYVFALSPTPASALTYQVDYEHAITDLANTWDEPALPEDFHDLLIMATLCDEYEHRSDDRYSNAVRQYDERFRELKAWLANHRAALQGRAPKEVAPLGAWYPRQTW